MTMQMPGAVPDRSTITVQAVKKRTGLIPMLVDSQHQIAIPQEDAEPLLVYVRARTREDFPRAKAVFLCLHPGCAGKQWDTLATMQDAHPQRTVMAKRGEVHLYGLWSNEPAALPAKVKAAEELVAKLRTEKGRAEKLVEKLAESEDIARIERAEKRVADVTVRLVAAEGDLGKVKGCIGLLAPPERGSEE